MEGKKGDGSIFILWLNWVVATGGPAVAVMAAPWVTGPWMALLCLGLATLMVLYMRYCRLKKKAFCGLVLWLEMRTMWLSALVMLVICVFFSQGYAAKYYGEDLINPGRPFLTVLVIAPVSLLLVLWVKIRGERNIFCRYCIQQHGMGIERGFIGKVFSEERPFQINLLLILTAAVCLVTWPYYTFRYVNVNINSADVCFLTILPLLIWLACVVYISIRYFSLWGYYYQNFSIASEVQGEHTMLRYLVFSHDHLLLSQDDEERVAGATKLDTPAQIITRFMEHPTDEFAGKVLAELAGVGRETFRLRPMYSNMADNGRTNTFHYIVEVMPKEGEGPNHYEEDSHRELAPGFGNLPGKWFSLRSLQQLINHQELAPMMFIEFNRLFKVAMAWKAYDINGCRKYRVKNYKPMFRLHGIIDWDVDFNNPRWLEVAHNNEDHFLFRFKRLWSRLMSVFH